ncbi:MAG: bifunctional diguanylate cyclase/phosphodiesterase [Oscillospiraceae bacterium]|nr:bifunctional diguanylate cyclase/phosphodiesterase [Oscillospiraceae bacterium]
MSKNVPESQKKKRVSSPLSYKLFVPMILLSLLQMGAFFLVLAASGEFSYIKRYAYDMFSEKTENRKNYVEHMLTGNVTPLYDAAEDINSMTEAFLEEKGCSAADISSDKAVNKDIIRLSSKRLVELLRKTSVNDVCIILDSGELYCKDGLVKKSGLYLRDMDTSSDDRTGNSDLLMEIGSSDIAEDMGITLDSEWSAHLEVSKVSEEDMDFFFETMETARDNPDIPVTSLGHWTGFSAITPMGQPSMKYSVPLRASDGTVYGVISAGILEKTFLSTIPSNDFFNESACYILGEDSGGTGIYTPVIHSGAIYSRLVTGSTVISERNKLSPGIYDFNADSDIDSIGCILPMKLYSAGSPYIKEKWALISVADRDRILSIYNTIISMLLLSTIISAVFSIICAVMISRAITTPVEKIAALLDEKKSDGGIISFAPSGITEIDRLSGSITELQIAVREQASRVSKIISMADMGIGVFMYEPRDRSVFMGESLIKLLNIGSLPVEDTVVGADDFLNMVSEIDDGGELTSSGFITRMINVHDESESIEFYSGALNRWFRCRVMSGQNNIIGLVMDVTGSVIEKKKIEYERDYDVTTGLLNRRAYLNKVGGLFAAPDKLKTAAFIMWDMDNLKYVNDTYGHDFGDDYIKTAANVFKLFRDYGGVVSRLSGDEFNVFLYGYDSKDEIRSIINIVRDKLNESYCTLADGTHFRLRASGGVSWYPDDSTSFETLIKYADFAMYTIKHSTKGRLAEFDLSSYNKDSILITGVEEMNRIIEEESVKYAFQSIISAKTGEIFGYEALMRPQSELFRSPLELIRIAKTGAKLYDIERLTWKIALRSFRKLREAGSVDKNARVFINSLSDCKMKPEDIKLIESENGDILDRVVMEILEGEQANEEFMKAKQKRIEKWNGLAALDDFGCGYNSEYALITLNPDLIKIDRSIISGCDSDISRQNIIMSLVSHAKLRNILVLAEGVETGGELKTVIECGVDLIQGYYVDRPLFEPMPVPDRIKNEIIGCQPKIAI